MMRSIKSEFRKLRTVRSTYGILFVAVAFTALIAGYAKGYRLEAGLIKENLLFQDSILNSVSVAVVFGTIAALLLITHEYRYNTVLYTLASSRNRYAPLLAKVIAVTGFSLALTICIALLAPVFCYMGLALGGHSLPAQNLYFGDFVWRLLFYAWGYSMVGLLIGAILRSQVVAIVTFLLFPSMIEGLLSLVLKEKAAYLPFNSLSAIISGDSPLISPAKAALTVSLYIAGGLLTALFLMRKRDAN